MVQAEQSRPVRLTEKFLDGKIPEKGESNDYFFFAALHCKNEGYELEQAIKKIEPMYLKWSMSDYYSNRPWKDVVGKIKSAYNE